MTQRIPTDGQVADYFCEALSDIFKLPVKESGEIMNLRQVSITGDWPCGGELSEELSGACQNLISLLHDMNPMAFLVFPRSALFKGTLSGKKVPLRLWHTRDIVQDKEIYRLDVLFEISESPNG